MAAILCKGCGSACDGFCKLISLPCQLFGKCCSGVTDGIVSLCDNPFCIYVTVALAINIPSISCGVSSIAYGFGCKASLWHLGNMIFCLANIVAALYIAIRFNELRRDPTATSDGTNTRGSGLKKAGEILCNDPVVAIYILVLIGFFVWLCLGTSWRASGQMDCGDDNTLALVGSSLGLGYSFFGVGFMALCCSLCCSCCCNDSRQGPNPYYSQNNRPNNNNNNRPTNGQATNNSSVNNNDIEYGATATAPVAAPASASAPIATATAVPSDPYSKHSNVEEPIQATVVPNPPATAPPYESDTAAKAKEKASEVLNLGFKKAQKLMGKMKK